MAILNKKHNLSKVLVLIILDGLSRSKDVQAYWSPIELSTLTGVSAAYLQGRMTRWARWGYVNQAVQTGKGRPFYVYSLAPKGKAMLAGLEPGQYATLLGLLHKRADLVRDYLELKRGKSPKKGAEIAKARQ
jgi:predicted ArsR family transcriptional regulator